MNVSTYVRVVDRLTSFLEGDGVLHVITGKGLHSKGEARIKPAVIHYLTGRGLT